MATAVAASLGVDGGWCGCQLRPRKPYHHHSHSKGSSTNSSLRLVPSSPPKVKASLAPSAHPFPLKQALTAASLALAGDTIAQVTQRWRNYQQLHLRGDGDSKNADGKDSRPGTFSGHDWLRALRMVSYGFLFYGPGSYAWYQFLDRCLPLPTLKNLLLKVLLNQIILGPCVIVVVFAWNNLWQGRLSQLPEKYRKDAFPTLLYGFRFWIPVSILNFWYVSSAVFLVYLFLILCVKLCYHDFGAKLKECNNSGFYVLYSVDWFDKLLHKEKNFSSLKFKMDKVIAMLMQCILQISRVVPLQARVAFMSMGSIFWNFYLSSTMSK
ncbi:hypothetical protein Tsubulata_037976 [Turnera subulata]|uniref:Peroxisomal membrane protein n=1 Tax=Turnera subulata TaxID=218843 RepID=A0A9Q0G1D4_9ROSI|nr:hypothetical protein Tsubulata_037976 [Turnera subulata]